MYEEKYITYLAKYPSFIPDFLLIVRYGVLYIFLSNPTGLLKVTD